MTLANALCLLQNVEGSGKYELFYKIPHAFERPMKEKFQKHMNNLSLSDKKSDKNALIAVEAPFSMRICGFIRLLGIKTKSRLRFDQ